MTTAPIVKPMIAGSLPAAYQALAQRLRLLAPGDDLAAGLLVYAEATSQSPAVSPLARKWACPI